jgi:hypothetical protein
MLDCGSSDLLTLAHVGLQAAIRDADDLLALLPGDPPARSTPQRSVEKHAAVVAAHAA